LATTTICLWCGYGLRLPFHDADIDPMASNAATDATATLPAAGRRDASIDHDAADLAAGLAEIGLTPKAAWYSAAVLWVGGGLLFTGLHTIDPTAFPRVVFYLGWIAIPIGLLSLVGGLRFDSSSSITEWTTHARLAAGLGIYLAAVISLHGRVVAFALVPLLTVPSPCYLFAWRPALPYVVAGALIVCPALLMIDGPARIAHALVSTSAFLVIAAAIVVTRQRSLHLAHRNRRLAYTDALTGIANMRSLRERASAGLGKSSGVGQPFALFAMDLDNFKLVNDRFDHSTGDRVLRAVALALGEELDADDLVVRRGGDEFAVLAAHPGERDLDDLRERLEGAIERARKATCPQITPSGTVGFICTRPGEELGGMMERADQALHMAKVASRARQPQRGLSTANPPAVKTSSSTGSGTGETLAIGAASHVEIRRARPPGRDLNSVADALRRSNPDWTFAALLLALGGLLTASLSIAQLVEPLTPLVGTAIATGSVALALGCTWAGIVGVSPRWLHLPWLAAYGLLAVEIALAGPSGTALLDLIPAIVMYGFLVFEARTAALYLLLGQAMYAAFAIGGGFAQGTARAVTTTVVVAVVGGLVAKLRQVTVRFTRTGRELSEVDALTGVANVRALRERVVDTIKRASSRKTRPIVVAIDLDEFKQVNDLHSHSTGDLVLVAVARAISEHVRVNELVARRGGDEFVVVIDDADPDYADAVAQRIADAIARARSRVCPDLRPTATVAAVRWQPGQTSDDLLYATDVALHMSKVESRSAPDLAATA
jgi:diguanylate cyclase (GGDEF)-like protein